MTTARRMCLEIRSKLALRNDADFGLFEMKRKGMCRMIPEEEFVEPIVRAWSAKEVARGSQPHASAPPRPRRAPHPRITGHATLLYMRAIYLPDTSLEDEEMSATHVADSAHRLAFGDAVAKVREGLYDVSLEQAALLAALHCQSVMGDHDPGRDKKGALKRCVPPSRAGAPVRR